jgi:hypothetical protein
MDTTALDIGNDSLIDPLCRDTQCPKNLLFRPPAVLCCPIISDLLPKRESLRFSDSGTWMWVAQSMIINCGRPAPTRPALHKKKITKEIEAPMTAEPFETFQQQSPAENIDERSPCAPAPRPVSPILRTLVGKTRTLVSSLAPHLKIKAQVRFKKH